MTPPWPPIEGEDVLVEPEIPFDHPDQWPPHWRQ